MQIGLEGDVNLQFLMKGGELTKVKSNSWQKKRFYKLQEDCETMWHDSDKIFNKSNTFSINDIDSVRQGRGSEGLQRYTDDSLGECCFSIVFKGKRKNLDLVANSSEEAKQWVAGLEKVIAHMDNLNSQQKREQYPSAEVRQCCTRNSLVFSVEMNRAWIISCMRKADKNGDNMMTLKELKHFLHQINIEVDDTYAAALFERCDTSKSGTLEGEEIKHFYELLTDREEINVIYGRYAQTEGHMSAADLLDFLTTEQKESRSLDDVKDLIDKYEPDETAKQKKRMTKDGFLRYLSQPEGSILNPAHQPLYQDMSQPLNHYFISSSHNTYLMEDQLKGPSSTEAYIRQAGRQADRQTGRQTRRHAGRQTGRREDGKTGRRADGKTVRQAGRQTGRQTSRREDGQTRRQADTQAGRQADTQADKQAGRQADRQTGRREDGKTGRRALLKSCRCVELDVWDGPNGEPLIYHGHTLTSKVLFKDVIKAIKEYAFKASEYPVILSLENHCTVEQQKLMAHHMTSILGSALLTHPLGNEMSTALPSPQDLKGRILVKGKRLNKLDAAFNNNNAVDIDDVVSEEDEAAEVKEEDPKTKAKNSKIKLAQELSDLVIYCKSVHFNSFEHSKEKQAFYEMASFKESKAKHFADNAASAFVHHNMDKLSRVYPAGSRTDSSNYNPVPMWNAGCQIVALNFQTRCKQMDLNQGRFLPNGKCGYILKPEFMRNPEFRFDPNNPSMGPWLKKKALHIMTDLKDESVCFNPTWNKNFKFTINVPELAIVRFVVEDYDAASANDFIGQYTLPFTSMQYGYRHIPLLTQSGDVIPSAGLFVHIMALDD
ncbi:hypothetical protein NFI96_034696 [Prochilodus magdalenae]|nr:hypothetical protein NFI96_034696 [Prochilodus magdalenae]